MGQRWKVENQWQRDKLVAHIDMLRLAGKVPVVEFINEKAHPKTPQQIRYAHSLITAAANHLDKPESEIKTDSKREWGVIEVSTCTIGENAGNRTARLKSFSEYTAHEMNGYLYGMEVWLSENGIKYTPPEHQ